MRVQRLASSEQFRLAYRQGTRYSDDLVTIYVRETGFPVSRLGISVARGVGTAVRRNRLRRRVREAFRQLQQLPPSGVDIVMVPRRRAHEVPFAELAGSLRRVLTRAGFAGGPADSR